ncbi:hypothetical protein ACPV50_12875 [Vibrio astriarenae]
MKTLYLHIGSHKTGTTSIQKSLFLSKSTLGSHNFSFFAKSPDGKTNESGNSSCWLEAPLTRNNDSYSAKITDPELLFSLANQEEKENVIVSAEGLSWISDEVELKRYKEIIDRYFSEVVVIIYIRRQDMHVISHHQEGSKRSTKPERAYYGDSTKCIPGTPELYDSYLNYYKKVKLWSGVFGERSLVIRLFEKEKLTSGNAVNDFFAVLGITSGFKPIYTNEGVGLYQSKVGHLINQHIDDKHLARRIRRSLPEDQKSLPSKKEALDFYDYYRESNALLNQEYHLSNNPDLFDEDFSKYPDKAQDEWNEETANQTILVLLDTISKESSVTYKFKKFLERKLSRYL